MQDFGEHSFYSRIRGAEFVRKRLRDAGLEGSRFRVAGSWDAGFGVNHLVGHELGLQGLGLQVFRVQGL